MLKTLPPDTVLVVVERVDQWLQVIVESDGARGWVYYRYTRDLEHPPPPPRSSDSSSRELLIGLLVVASLICALVIVARAGSLSGSQLASANHVTHFIISLLIGAATLLNQFGPILARLSEPYFELARVSFFWEVNSLVLDYHIDYSRAILLIVALGGGVALLAPRVDGSRTSFLQGVYTGFFALPVFAVLLALAAAALYIVALVMKLIGFVVSIIAIPINWVFAHILLPVLRFLSIPLVWLWDHVLREILGYVSVPFIWLWNVLLAPLITVLIRYVLRPLGMLFLGTLVSLVAVLPFWVIGCVVLEDISNATCRKLNPLGLFSRGVATGFLLLDASILFCLSSLNLNLTAPPLTLLVPVGLQFVVILRLLGRGSAATAQTCPPFKHRLLSYWQHSKLELLTTFLLVPLGFLMAVRGDDN